MPQIWLLTLYDLKMEHQEYVALSFYNLPMGKFYLTHSVSDAMVLVGPVIWHGKVTRQRHSRHSVE